VKKVMAYVSHKKWKISCQFEELLTLTRTVLNGAT